MDGQHEVILNHINIIIFLPEILTTDNKISCFSYTVNICGTKYETTNTLYLDIPHLKKIVRPRTLGENI